MDRTDERRRRPPQGRDPGRERQRPVRAEERWDDPPRRREGYPPRERRPAPPGDPRRSGYDRTNTRDPRQGTRPSNDAKPRQSRQYNAPPRRDEYEQPRRRSEYEQPRQRSAYEQPRRSRPAAPAQPRPRDYEDPRRREQVPNRAPRPAGQGQAHPGGQSRPRPSGQGQPRRSSAPQSRQPGSYGAPPRKRPPQQDPRRRTYGAPARRAPEAPPQRPRTEAERRRRREQERRRRQMQQRRNMVILILVAAAAMIAVCCLYTPRTERPDRPQIFHPDKPQEVVTEPPTEPPTEAPGPVGPPIEVTPITSLADLAILEVPDYVDVQIIDVDGVSRRGVQLEEINGIVLHYVGNPGSTAQQNHDWYTEKNSEVSSHFVVGLNGEVIQCVPLDEKSSASNHRNRDTISIEICHPDSSGKFSDVTYNSVIELVAWLVKACDLEVDAVIRHYEVTGKICPKYYVENDEAWQQLRADVAARLGRQYPVNEE